MPKKHQAQGPHAALLYAVCGDPGSVRGAPGAVHQPLPDASAQGSGTVSRRLGAAGDLLSVSSRALTILRILTPPRERYYSVGSEP